VGIVLELARSRRLLVMLLLGFAAGVPYQLTGTTLSAWMTDAGVAVGTIGLFSLVTLPYSLRLAWTPLVDRFQLPLLGRRRGWLLVFQLGLLAAIAALGGLDPRAAPRAVALAALLVAFLSTSQDVVSDAYRTDLLDRSERAFGTAVYIFGYRMAMLLSGGFALLLADHLPWRAVYGLMALTLTVGIVTTWRAPEPPTVEPPRSLRAAVTLPLRDYFQRRGAVALLFLVTLFRLSDLVANVMVMPFLLSLQFSKTEVGTVYKIMGTAATIVGTLGGGALAARIGLYRAMLAFALSQALANLGYTTLALCGHHRLILVVAVGVDNLCTGLSIAALDAFLMALCNKRFSATQYALLASASGLFGRLLGGVSGYLAHAVGWPLFFVCTTLLASPALALLFRYRREIIAADLGPPAADGSAATATGA
jgi:PAT family beta-lactamase induction signal transducer AmpG